jgi:hypothetical protein
MNKKMIVAKMIDRLDGERRELNHLIEISEEGDMKDYFQESYDSLIAAIWKLDLAFPLLRMKKN